MAANGSVVLSYDNFCTKTGTGDKIKYSSIPKNTETQKDHWNKPWLVNKDFQINSNEGMWSCTVAY